MQNDRAATDKIVDLVWSRALDKIVKGGGTEVLRSSLGDEIDLFVPQTVTAALLSANPGFARMLYDSGYTSAKRNAYFVMRRLGMPTDFFWQFDYWTVDRAFTTVQKVMARIFAAMMDKQKQGHVEVASVDVARSTFTLAFDGCAECAGLQSGQPACYFHGGVFAGILASMLNRELDAYEEECSASGGKTCRFKVGKRDDREVLPPHEQWMKAPSVKADVAGRAEASLDHRSSRSLGNMVDVGYYQMLLSSSFLVNLELLEKACFTTGAQVGKALAPLLSRRFQGSPPAAIEAFYAQMRYMKVQVQDDGAAVTVRLAEAPEAVGPLAGAALVPFVSGELESLLSELMGKPVRYQSAVSEPGGLVLRFAP